MKNLILIALFLFVNPFYSQDINQYDSEGQRHGVWKKTFDGTKAIRYEGQFNHGKEVGLFKFYKYIDKKSVLSATKQFNELDDITNVKFYSSKGKVISEGKMTGKKFVGRWNYYHKNSNQFLRIENYDNNGIQQGELLVYYKNGQLAEKSNFLLGKLQGASTWYNEEGIIIKEYIYDNNELHGLAKHYSNSGKLIVEGHYKKNKKHGVWKYYENGKLVKEKNFTRQSKNPYKKK